MVWPLQEFKKQSPKNQRTWFRLVFGCLRVRLPWCCWFWTMICLSSCFWNFCQSNVCEEGSISIALFLDEPRAYQALASPRSNQEDSRWAGRLMSSDRMLGMAERIGHWLVWLISHVFSRLYDILIRFHGPVSWSTTWRVINLLTVVPCINNYLLLWLMT